MNISSSSSVLLNGMARAQQTVHRSAQTIAAEGPDIDALVELRLGATETAAIVSAFRSIDDTQERLIDMLA